MIFVPWKGCWYLKSCLVGEGKTGAREGICAKARQSVGARGVYVSIRSSGTTVSPNDSNAWHHTWARPKDCTRPRDWARPRDRACKKSMRSRQALTSSDPNSSQKHTTSSASHPQCFGLIRKRGRTKSVVPKSVVPCCGGLPPACRRPVSRRATHLIPQRQKALFTCDINAWK